LLYKTNEMSSVTIKLTEEELADKTLDPNLKRGKIAFTNTLSTEAEQMEPQNVERLVFMWSQMRDKVGVMPEDGILAAKRFATACIQAALLPGTPEESLDKALDLYAGTNTVQTPRTFRLTNDEEVKNRGTSIEGYAKTGNEVHDNRTKMLAEAIESSIDKRSTEAFTIEDEDGDVRTFDAEVIDMIDDAAEAGELSVEGMRALGIVSQNFDTTKGVVSEDSILMADKLVSQEETNWYYNDQGHLTILCPSCRCEKIYPMGEAMFGCFECDTEFKFTMNLGDVF